MLKHWKRTLAFLGIAAAVALVSAGLALGKKPPKPPPEPPPPPPPPTVQYEITVLGTLPGYACSTARDVNSSGLVVGCIPPGAGGDLGAFVVVPEDTDGDGVPELWYRDDDDDGFNDLMVVLNDLIDPDSGWDLRSACGINDAGQIVGSGYNPDGQKRAYRFTPGVDGGWGVVDDLGTLGGDPSYSYGYDINENGDVVGYSDGRGFLCTEDDGMVDIGSLVEGEMTCPRAINNSQWVTGYSGVPNKWHGYYKHAFLWAPGCDMEDLGYYAPTKRNDIWQSFGEDINEQGHIVGSVWGAGRHAFLYTVVDGMIDLGTLDGYNTYAAGINSSDEVVGHTASPVRPLAGFLYTNKTETGAFVMFKLEDLVTSIKGEPGAYQGGGILARRINDAGQICGFAECADGYTQAVLLTPVSE